MILLKISFASITNSMKKLSLLSALLIIATMLFGQNPITNTQLPYPNFNTWTGDSIPSFWYSYSNMDCELTAGCDIAIAAGVFQNHHRKVPGIINNACQLYTVKKSGYNINGAMTTGKSIVQNVHLTDTSNYVYTQRNGTCNWLFSGRPDSIVLWAKFSFLQNTYNNASLRVHIHGNVDYRDMPTSTASTPQEGKIANAFCDLTNPATTPNSNGVYKSGWTRFVFPFTYWDHNNNIITTPTVQNTDQPYYILGSLSTNKVLGVGENDSITFDEIFCIYDKGLASLKIEGVEMGDMRDFFNTCEYLYTHGMSNNSGSVVYQDTTHYCYTNNNDLPKVTVTPRSSLILSCTVTQATLPTMPNQVPTCNIRIIHNDSSYYNYSIKFTNLILTETVSLDHADGSYTGCANETITVTASGSNSYVWSNGTTGSVFHPTASGTYQVTATDANGCQSTANAYVEIYPMPNVTINGSNNGSSTICSGKTVNLLGGGAETYHWSTGETGTSIVVNSANTYNVTAYTSYGCSGTASYTLIAHENPVVSISGPDAICSGTTEVLIASGANTYSWSNGSSSESITISSGGSYSVTGTNTYGCTATASKPVTSKTTPTVSITGPSIVCSNSSVTLSIANPITGVSYSWSNGASGTSTTVSAAGPYTVTASLDGCESTATHTLTASMAPAVPTVTPGSACVNSTITLAASAAAGNTCIWYATESTQSILETGNTFTTPSLSTSTTYYVCAQNADGCYSSRTPVTATILPSPTAPSVTNVSYCGEGDYTLTATSSNAVQWYSDNAGANEIPANQHIENTTTYYAAAIDGNGCRSALVPMTVTVNNVPAPPTVTTNPTSPICSNGSVSITFNATAPTGHTVKWYNPNLQYDGQGNQITRSVNGSTTYYAAISNNGTLCESAKTPVEIVINPIPSAPVLSCAPRCGAGLVTLNGSADGMTIKWFTNDGQYLNSGNSYTTNINTTTSFKATALNETTGCESSMASVVATVNPTYQTSFSQTVCDQFTWMGQTYTQSGEYTKTLQSINGCDSIVTLHLTVNNTLYTSFDTAVCNQFTWMGQTYTSSQDIVVTIPSSKECDSIITCHLTVLHSTQSTQSLTLCSNQLPYTYAGTTIESAGQKTIILTNAAGCDSVITLNVVVNPTPGNATISSTITSRCGAGSLTLNVAPGNNGTTCRWYETETGGTPTTQTQYTANLTESTTFYISSYNETSGCEGARIPLNVTVNPIPGEPLTENAARCGAGEVTLTATPGTNADNCRWYANNSSNAQLLYTGNNFTQTLTNNSQVYVESFNSTTNCKSSRALVIATINPIPSAPQVTPATHCGPLTADMSSYITSGSTLYRWYNSNEILLAENAHYTATFDESSSILVSNYNAQTTCEGPKATINITIFPTYNPQSIYDTICQYSHYQSYNINQYCDTPGDLTFTVNEQSSHQCDSLVTLYLHVKPQITYTFSDEACVSYTWNNTLYNQTGSYTQTFTAANGCDSVVTLQLTIFPNVTHEFSASSCVSYQWNDSVYTASGDYVQHFNNVHGCDSAVTLHLTIYSPSQHEFSDAACVSYTWNNSTYNQSGDYIQHFYNVHGCDSAVTLHLTIYPTVTHDFYDTACVNYTWNETTYSQSGIYTQHFSTSHGCDSTVNLHLTIYQTDHVTISDEVCAGVNYNLNGFDTTITNAGMHVLTNSGQNAHGCDSTTTLTLTVHPVKHKTLNEAICYNQSYSFKGMSLTQSGTYIDTLPTTHGCDSIVTLNLTVYPEKRDTITAEICLGDDFNEYGFNIPAPATSGIYPLTTSDMNGCDSTTILFLTVNQPAHTYLTAERCQGDPYNENGFNLNTFSVGVFSQQRNLLTSHGCDSTVHLTLTVHPVWDVTFTDIVCSGEHYNNYGFDTTLTQARNYTLIHENSTAYGCDSTTTLQLTVLPIPHTTINETICFNGSYNFNGQIITTAGTYLDTLTAANGCDSVITLQLTKYPEKSSSLTAHICLGESYQENGFDIVMPAASDSYEQVVTDVNGCDSTVTLQLFVHQQAETVIYDTLCLGEHYNQYGFDIMATEAGTLDSTRTLQTSYGCDSIVTLHLIIHPTHNLTPTATICSGENFTQYGFDTTFSQAGIYTLTHYDTNIYGCDSTTTVTLNVLPSSVFSFETEACESYTWNNMTYYESGDYNQTFLNTNGCDSVVTLHLTIHQPSAVSFYDTACVSYTWNGISYEESGIYTQHFNNIYGCDSTTTLHLTIYPVYENVLFDTICFNQEVVFNGESRTTTGVYTANLQSVHECDSTVVLNLFVYTERRDTITGHICAGESYTENGFNILTPASSGYHSIVTPDIHGCDSTTVLYLFVHQPVTTSLATTLCLGGQYNENGFEVTATEVGIHEYTQNLQDIHGCDSTVILTVTVNPTHDIVLYDSICAGATYSANGFDTTFAQPGTYPLTHFAPNQFGCDSTTTLMLTVHPVYNMTIQKMICESASFVFNGETLTEAGVYQANLTSIYGCDSLVTLNLTIGSEYRDTITAHICAGASYNQYGFDIVTPSATMYDSLNLIGSNGCDSISVLHLFVHYPDTSHIYTTLCQGESYRQNGFNVTATTAGEFTYERHTNTPYGCDSTIMLHLTVNPTHAVILYDTICAGSQYSNFGFDTLISTAGNYTLTKNGQNIYGCDSVTTLQLTVHPTQLIDLTQSACDSYVWNDSTYYESGIYTRHFTNIYGCDSTVTLHLTIHPSFNIFLTDEACEGDIYSNYGFTTEPLEIGTHILTHSDIINGCDSITQLELTVHPVYHHYISNMICESGSYNFNGYILTNAGVYTDTLNSIFGCDSIVTLELSVADEYLDTITGHICLGDVYAEYGFYIDTATVTGYYTNQQTSQSGCDSTTVLHLYVHEATYVNLEGSICLGNKYEENGFNLKPTEAGVTTHTLDLTSQFGCDSVVTLTLTTLPSYDIHEYDEVCAGMSYQNFGFDTLIMHDGLYVLTHEETNRFGCDSTVTLHLTVLPTYEQELNVSICYDEHYLFNEEELTEPGTYIASLSSIYGCDSIVTLNLNVYPEKRDTITDEICLGADYDRYGFRLTNPLVTDYHYLIKKDENGCDSTTVLLLYVREPDSTFLTAERCQGVRYKENGFNITTLNPGVFTYQNNLQNIYGCDSIVTLTLTVNPVHNIDLYDTICLGERYNKYGFDTLFSQAKTHTLTHYDQNVTGCDSTTVLQLTVLPIPQTFINTAICYNESYQFNGQTLTKSGTYRDTLNAVTGCDSIVTLNLTVHPDNSRSIVGHICKGDSYNENGFEILLPLESGVFSHTDADIHGCDSTTTLQLYVHELDTTHLNDGICIGESYTENGFNITPSEAGEFEYVRSEDASFGCEYTLVLHLTVHPTQGTALTDTVCTGTPYTLYGFDTTFTQTGTYTLVQNNQTVYGCDSTVTLTLSVLPTSTNEITESACESYTWNDLVYHQSGDYIQQFQAANGCDSTVTLHLTIYPAKTTEFEETACTSYQWNDSIYTISGDYVQHFETAHGCDSTVTLHLTIQPAQTYEFEESACVNYQWNESIYRSSGNYVQHLQTADGCDSTVTLHLTILNMDYTDFSETACESYSWNDSVYTLSGDYTQSFTNAAGCDSIVSLHLTVNYPDNIHYEAIICQGNTFDQYGFDTLITVTGTHTLIHEGVNIHGCDSTTTVTLTVNPVFSTDTTVEVCENYLPYHWDNDSQHTFWESDDYNIPFTTVNGCDSIIHLHLVVNPTYEKDTNVTVCQGALPYYFDADHSFSQGGVYNINLLTASGCDSIFHLHLTVTPNAEHDATQTICDSQLPYTFMGQQFDTAGTYDITESNGDNCLTITHFTLNVNPTYHHFDTVTVCQEALPYLYGSTPLPDSGSYDIHFSSALTCDSLVTVLLNVIPTAAGADELFVCGSDFPVSYGDSSFSVAGTYEVVFHRDGLCDSLVTLTLHQAQEYAFADTDFVCDHELPYLWRGMAFNESGIYYDSLTTGHGCDSVYSLNLTVNATQLVVSDPIVLCDGVSETWRGMVLSEAGTYRDTVIAASGCHEIHEVSVTVNPSYHFFDTVTLCSDELPYLWHDMTVSEAGTREDYHQTAGTFCDSVYHLTLYVNPSYHVTESASACDYDLPYLWHGQSLGASGVYHDTLVTADGCDSTFTLTFTVNASQHEVLADTVCQNTLPYAWRGHQINAAGNYADTIPNAAGCMDVFELHLSVLQSDVTTIYDTVCAGSLYDLHGFDTLALLPGTLYDQMTLANADGCDSVVNLVLAVLPSYFFEESAQTCENVPYLWHGNELIVEGTYYDSLLTASGCDSVFVLHLSLNPTYDVYVSDSAVREHLYTFDSLNSFVITPADSGTFFYDIQFYTLAHCDSIVHLTLFVAFNDGVEDFSFEPDFSFYPNPTQAMLNIKGQDMKRVDVFNLNGKLVLSQMPDTPEFTQLDVARFATGHYLVKVLLNDGRTVTGKIIVNRR